MVNSNLTSYQKANFYGKMSGNEMFRGFQMVRNMLKCIISDSSLSEDQCVKKLILRANSVNNENNTLSRFYTETETLLNEACDPICDQNYLQTMNKIVTKCVPEFVNGYLQRHPNKTNTAEISEKSMKIGQALPNFIKSTVCIKDQERNNELCTVQLLKFSAENKLLIKPPTITNATFIGLDGMASLVSSMNITALDLMGPKVFCTKCNLKVVQNLETFMALNLIPNLGAFSNNATSLSRHMHTKFIASINEVCGANALVSSIPNSNVQFIEPPNSNNAMLQSMSSESKVASSSVPKNVLSLAMVQNANVS
ncbi:hypothetical protein HMI56_000871 [Coelomomyces lativittatus]|nr:hypothetical protein HMI56_000871 [Coelomomyces lativittatus]